MITQNIFSNYECNVVRFTQNERRFLGSQIKKSEYYQGNKEITSF